MRLQILLLNTVIINETDIISTVNITNVHNCITYLFLKIFQYKISLREKNLKNRFKTTANRLSGHMIMN